MLVVELKNSAHPAVFGMCVYINLKDMLLINPYRYSSRARSSMQAIIISPKGVAFNIYSNRTVVMAVPIKRCKDRISVPSDKIELSLISAAIMGKYQIYEKIPY